MVDYDFKKGFLRWFKSPWGLIILIIGMVHQHMNWPLVFHVENNYGNLVWIEVDGFKYGKSGGRYSSHGLVITGGGGDKRIFSNFGFARGERRELVNVLHKKDKIGWYSTCLPWKSNKVEDLFLSSNCAIIMEIQRGGDKLISFEERGSFIKSHVAYTLFEIYWILGLCFSISIVSLVFFSKRN